jgi:Xaa-Pro aminopeptidase
MAIHKAMKRAAILLGALVLCASLGLARIRQPNSEYQARRAKVRASLTGPLVMFGFTGNESNLQDRTFYQENNFYYLTGFNEAGAALVLLPESSKENAVEGPHEFLYLQPRDPASERWNGPRLGPTDPDITEKTGFAAVEPNANLRGDLEKLGKVYPNFYALLPWNGEDTDPDAATWLAWMKQILPQANFRDVRGMLGAMRQVKSSGEIERVQRAVDASVDAQLAAMKMVRPGVYEYQVAAKMEYVHKFEGCDREAYDPIVGSGFFSTVLHYAAASKQINDGDVVVLDVAGEYGGYAADITRTLPANGKFTARQREIYEIVLGAQNAALAALKPGMTFQRTRPNSLFDAAYNYINTHGKDREGKSLGQYFIHGLGHHIGLYVHDAGDPWRALEAGMIVTIEPGIYIPEENLGVRIEDDVLITENGYKLLTARLPRSVEEIEKIMAEAQSKPPQQP